MYVYRYEIRNKANFIIYYSHDSIVVTFLFAVVWECGGYVGKFTVWNTEGHIDNLQSVLEINYTYMEHPAIHIHCAHTPSQWVLLPIFSKMYRTCWKVSIRCCQEFTTLLLQKHYNVRLVGHCDYYEQISTSVSMFDWMNWLDQFIKYTPRGWWLSSYTTIIM